MRRSRPRFASRPIYTRRPVESPARFRSARRPDAPGTPATAGCRPHDGHATVHPAGHIAAPGVPAPEDLARGRIGRGLPQGSLGALSGLGRGVGSSACRLRRGWRRPPSRAPRSGYAGTRCGGSKTSRKCGTAPEAIRGAVSRSGVGQPSAAPPSRDRGVSPLIAIGGPCRVERRHRVHCSSPISRAVDSSRAGG